MIIPLNIINIVGEVFYHVYRMKNGTDSKVVSTKSEYDNLSKEGAGSPSLIPGADFWLMSFGRPIWDTLDGEPHPGDVENIGDGKLRFWISTIDVKRYSEIGTNFSVKRGDYTGTLPNVTIIVPIIPEITVVAGIMELL